MRDWTKFAWKKGDVLVNKDRTTHIIFEEFTDDTYTNFIGKHYYCKIDKNERFYIREDCVATEKFILETEDAAQKYIKTIEKKLGGKLNRENLEIEKPEFKDGDIVVHNCGMIVLVKEISSRGKVYFHAYMENGNVYTQQTKNVYCGYMNEIKRLATEQEKQHLFDALAKKGKAWDAENKQIINLKPKVELKPFDKVLVRNAVDEKWRTNLFESQSTEDCDCRYQCMVSAWRFCIPYEGNEHLLGTTDKLEGGENG